jgi:hypothetical protein
MATIAAIDGVIVERVARYLSRLADRKPALD